ncbi:hypothetical protein AGMMS50222_03370 [Endomicrobiia bacterium]|nr:hypothetical protein AGMMS49531_00980 [Endomicrobiia bacterium]GHT64398.1 hypothetical protein AGMMS49556_02420 [Endomicrobiia bacterium]GHT69803.1 hypothetical protein AGMMS49950_03310 [Endomicrobiia bacterium]GHT74360.1 hypothetical protein AGMMS50222_03370 [Endomicrobiia bacterium]
MSAKDKRESIWIKIYTVLLFLCGIGIWFTVWPVDKHTISIDLALDKKIVDVLTANGIVKDDVLSQYTRERNTKATRWNEFYKTIKLKSGKSMQHFETSFRKLERSMKVALNKVDNSDGSTTYKFYSSNKNYSNITFVPKKSLNNRN